LENLGGEEKKQVDGRELQRAKGRRFVGRGTGEGGKKRKSTERIFATKMSR